MFLENESYTIHVIILVICLLGKKNNFPKLILEDKCFWKRALIYKSQSKSREKQKQKILCLLPYSHPWLLLYMEISDELYPPQKITSNEKKPLLPISVENTIKITKSTEHNWNNISICILLSYFSEFLERYLNSYEHFLRSVTHVRQENMPKKSVVETSLGRPMVKTCVSTREGPGLIPSGRTKIPQAVWRRKKKEKRQWWERKGCKGWKEEEEKREEERKRKEGRKEGREKKGCCFFKTDTFTRCNSLQLLLILIIRMLQDQWSRTNGDQTRWKEFCKSSLVVQFNERGVSNCL